MSASRVLLVYVACLVALVALDMLWLRVIAASWYQKGIGHLMASEINLWAGGLFYLMYPVGLLVFAVLPGLEVTPLWRTALMGGLFGFFAYATYDLTNLAVMKDWPVGLSILDVAWGSAVSAAVAAAGRWVASFG